MGHWLKKTKKKTGLPPGSIVYTGSKTNEPITLSLIEYNNKSLTEKIINDPSELSPHLNNNLISWINITGIHNENLLKDIGQIFDLHNLLLEDIASTQQRPKYEEFEQKYIYMTLKMLHWNENLQRITHEHVSLVIGKDLVLSFQEEEGDVFGWVRERIRMSKGKIRSMSSDYLAFALIDAIVDGYYVAIEKFGNRIEELEEKIISNPNSKILNDLNMARHEMIALRKAMYPLRDAIQHLLKSENELIHKKTIPYYKDLYDHTLQTNDTIDSYREYLNSLFDMYLSTVSYKMNDIMKVLTIFSAIFIPLTFIVGIYGMNFENMPELKSENGYFIVCGIMFLITIGMLFWFRKKRWF